MKRKQETMPVDRLEAGEQETTKREKTTTGWTLTKTKLYPVPAPFNPRRGPGGRFGKGNSGRPKGSKGKVTEALAEACQELFHATAPSIFPRLLNYWADPMVILATLKFLAERGFGKVPDKLDLGAQPSLENLLYSLQEKERQRRLAGPAPDSTDTAGDSDGPGPGPAAGGHGPN